jgi:hypothetical protein
LGYASISSTQTCSCAPRTHRLTGDCVQALAEASEKAREAVGRASMAGEDRLCRAGWRWVFVRACECVWLGVRVLGMGRWVLGVDLLWPVCRRLSSSPLPVTRDIRCEIGIAPACRARL